MNRLLPALLALLAGAFAAAVGCGSGASRARTPSQAATTSAVASPTSTPPITPTATLPPAPPTFAAPTPAPVLRTTGWAVYTRGADLYLGSLDGKTERPLTKGAYARCGNASGGCRSSWYAGEASSNGQRWLYYVKALGPLDPQEFALPTLHYALARGPFEGGDEEALLRFDGFDANANSRVEVSPDGGSVAYGAIDGVHRFDVASHEDVPLVANEAGCSRKGSTSTQCDIYSDPRWSPDGTTLVLMESFFEGSVAASLDMTTPGAKPQPLNRALAATTRDGRPMARASACRSSGITSGAAACCRRATASSTTSPARCAGVRSQR